MRRRIEAWPLAPGGLLVLTALGLVWALRGPDLALPRSPAAAVLALLAAYGLGLASRAAAGALSWAAHALTAADLFADEAPLELLDEEAARALTPELRARLAEACGRTLGTELPVIGANDDFATERQKEKQIDEVVALARAHGRATPAGPSLDGLEARVDGARGLVVSLGASGIAVGFVGVHDLALSRSVAHAVSGIVLLAVGVVLAIGAVAALGRARTLSRQLARDTLLQLVVGGASRVGTS